MRDTVHYAPGERLLCGSESQTAITTEEPALVIRNLCNDGLIGTGAIPGERTHLSETKRAEFRSRDYQGPKTVKLETGVEECFA